MWADFTSDLKEFASGAAEETTAAASKVGVTIGGNGDTSSDDNGGTGLLYNITPLIALHSIKPISSLKLCSRRRPVPLLQKRENILHRK